MTKTRITISGFLVGNIWMPSAECWKDLDYDATDMQARTDGKMTLRDHVLRATMDGDFQSCAIASGTLSITTETFRNSTRTTKTRVWSLDQFPSIADMLHDDPDWFPFSPEDYESEDLEHA